MPFRSQKGKVYDIYSMIIPRKIAISKLLSQDRNQNEKV